MCQPVKAEHLCFMLYAYKLILNIDRYLNHSALTAVMFQVSSVSLYWVHPFWCLDDFFKGWPILPSFCVCANGSRLCQLMLMWFCALHCLAAYLRGHALLRCLFYTVIIAKKNLPGIDSICVMSCRLSMSQGWTALTSWQQRPCNLALTSLPESNKASADAAKKWDKALISTTQHFLHWTVYKSLSMSSCIAELTSTISHGNGILALKNIVSQLNQQGCSCWAQHVSPK